MKRDVEVVKKGQKERRKKMNENTFVKLDE